jgi:eight-cysteine-cluster-containing protein
MRYLLLAFLIACGGSKASTSTPTPSSSDGSGSAVAGDCVKSGCSGTVCVEPGKEVVTTCEFKPEYACYRDATCARQSDGSCGWTKTPALDACLAHPPAGAAGDTPQ